MPLNLHGWDFRQAHGSTICRCCSATWREW